MKQKILICLVAFVAFCSFSTLRAQGWDKTLYTLPNSSSIESAVETQNGSLVLLSNNLTVLKTDKRGNIIWQRDIIRERFQDGGIIIQAKDKGFFVFSKIIGDTSRRFETSKVSMIKLDSNGNEQFRISPSRGWFTGVTLSLDSNDIIISSFVVDTSGSNHALISKISASGVTLWSKRYENGVVLNPEFGGDGFIYAAFNDRVIKLDANGDAVWDKLLPSSISNIKLKRSKDGRLLVLGDLKLDYDGTILWQSNLLGSYITVFSEYKNSKKIATLTNSTGFRSLFFVQKDSFGQKISAKVIAPTSLLSWNYDYGDLTIFSDMIATSDNGFLAFGRSGFKPYIAKFTEDGLLLSNSLKGKIHSDSIQNCRLDATESTLSNRLISAEKSNEIRWAVTDAQGNYEMQIDTGNYTVKTFLPNSNWRFCTPSVSKQILTVGTTDTANFALQAAYYCPQMRISASMQGLRRCFDNNNYQIRYTNEGTIAAQNAFITLKLDSLLEYVGASRPLSSRVGQTLRFNLGMVPIGFDDQFSVQVRVKCGDSTRLGQSLCTEARIFPDSICIPAPNWSGANIVVSGRCDRDSVRFLIQNTGTGASSNLRRQIVEDEIVFLNGTINVPASGSRAISVPANGKTWRLTMDQEPNNPLENRPTAVIEGCRNAPNLSISTGFVNQFPTDDGSPTVKNICAVLTGSYDPNDKEGLPLGYKSSRFIEQNQSIDYRIRFQNTGNDTAFTVVLRDTLSDFLDISSIKTGASSHKYSWTIDGQNVLVFRFDNIKLVDSFRNVAASQGFVSFKINQKKDVALGSKINNLADIYFDYNAPIRTNKTLHTVGKDFIISVLETNSALPNVKINVFPNPFNDEATIEIEDFGKKGPLSIKSNFSLFDAFGRQLRSEKFEGNTWAFKRQDLTTGIYFFRIENNGQLIGTGKFLIK